MRFAKGHGTGNDFVILPDPDGVLELSPALAARLCDRRTGLGADGVLRAVRVAALSPARAGSEGAHGLAMPRPGTSAAEWFMDYRNADGSIAEMCGNGIRVFARYLLDSGLAMASEFTVATRAGLRSVRAEPDGAIAADMGAPAVLGPGRAIVGGRACEGLRVSVGNPHLACLVDTPVEEFDLSRHPVLDPRQFPADGNVEVVQVTHRGAVRMRVSERGSGETRSCGTGAVAAAVAAARAAGESTGTWQVSVPGGELTVTLDGAGSLLAGPAVIVAAGELREDWVRGERPPAPVA
jgi:diaminopimelate epimerase